MTEPFWNVAINAMNIIEITGFVANFIFVYYLLKEMRTSNYNQKTIELRNEMNAIVGAQILANGIFNSTISLYIAHHKKLISHKNDSLLFEFYINKNVFKLITACKNGIEKWNNDTLKCLREYIEQKKYQKDIEAIHKKRHHILFPDREDNGGVYEN